MRTPATAGEAGEAAIVDHADQFVFYVEILGEIIGGAAGIAQGHVTVGTGHRVLVTAAVGVAHHVKASNAPSTQFNTHFTECLTFCSAAAREPNFFTGTTPSITTNSNGRSA